MSGIFAMGGPPPHVTTTSPAGRGLLHGNESCCWAAYLDTAGIYTIGWGCTRYPDTGKRVQKGDTCTQAQADAWFALDLAGVERSVDDLMVDALLQRQFDALSSFAYNEGSPALKNSTLRKLVNANPEHPGIRSEFMKWFYEHQNGSPIATPEEGLWIRRHREADFYFGVSTPCPPYPYARAA